MSAEKQVQLPSLEARSPFELRVNLATGYSEPVIKKALASGDMGFLHSFTTALLSMGQAFGSWRGRQAVNGVACTAITPTRGT